MYFVKSEYVVHVCWWEIWDIAQSYVCNVTCSLSRDVPVGMFFTRKGLFQGMASVQKIFLTVHGGPEHSQWII